MAGSLRRGIGALHSWKSLRYPLEEVLDVMSQLRASLDKHQIVLLGLLFTLLRCNLSLVVQISLVANQHNDNIVASLGPDIVDPLLGILE